MTPDSDPRMTLNAVRLLVAVGFIAIVWALAYLGGWHRLARQYKARSAFVGRRLRFQSLQLRGWCGYNGCVRAGADPFHLSLALWPILRLGHPPLLIPWSDVSARAESGRFIRVVVLHFAAEPGVAMRISERLAKKLAAESRGAFEISTWSCSVLPS